jgi:hypothetical protein
MTFDPTALRECIADAQAAMPFPVRRMAVCWDRDHLSPNIIEYEFFPEGFGPYGTCAPSALSPDDVRAYFDDLYDYDEDIPNWDAQYELACHVADALTPADTPAYWMARVVIDLETGEYVLCAGVYGAAPGDRVTGVYAPRPLTFLEALHATLGPAHE